MNNCATCKWWKPLANNYGRCHANPPQLDNVECDQYWGLFPKIHGDEFCGQWKGEEKIREPGRLNRIDYLCGRGGPMWADEAKKDEPSEAFFAALGEIFTPSTEEQREKAEQVLKELLKEWKDGK